MTSTTLFILADAPFALFFIFVIYLIAGEVAIVPLLMLPLGLALGLGMKGRVEKYAAETMEESNKKNGLLIEAIDGIESVKAVSAEWKIKERWRNLTLDISSSELKTKLITSIATSSTQTVHQLSYVGVIAVGAYLISQGDITMGALIACSIISGRALTPLAQIPSLIVKWKQAKIALNVLDQIMAMPSEQNADRHVVPDACTGHISVSELAFSYDINARPLEVANLTSSPATALPCSARWGRENQLCSNCWLVFIVRKRGVPFLTALICNSLQSSFCASKSAICRKKCACSMAACGKSSPGSAGFER